MKFAQTPRALLPFLKDRFSRISRISSFLLLIAILTIHGAAAQPNTVTVVVPGTAAPWSCSGANAGYVYGDCSSASPVVVSAANGLSFQPGDSLTVTYVSGMASQYGTCPTAFCYDANGDGSAWNDRFDPCCGYLPSKYIPPSEYPVGVMTLVGVFTDSNGAIVGTPHRLGDGPTTLIVPAGATQFQMGVNDDFYSDNNGSFVIRVSSTGCQVVNNTSVVSFPTNLYLGSDGLFAYRSMAAIFAPTDPAGNSISLADAAQMCNVDDFNWQQTVNVLPPPTDPSLCFTSPSLCSEPRSNPLLILTAPPQFPDPVPGGYVNDPPGHDPYPFYLYLTDCIQDFIGIPGCTPVKMTSTLIYRDTAGFPLLPIGQVMQFTTSLVGIKQGNPGPAFVSWTWESNFNGTSGGTAKIDNLLPPDPGSGTGTVRVTSINGLPQTPLAISCTATPDSLWPPNGRSVVVTISGQISGGTSELLPNGTSYRVIDEYGQVQPTGTIAVDAGGNYSFRISLIAARNGDGRDGRTYTILVRGNDRSGNVGACAAAVTVPHDQRH